MKKFFILIAYFNKWKLSSKDIEEIREELAEEGYVRNRKTKNAKKKPTKPVLDKYVASDGTEIFVGKTINKMII